MSAGKGLYIITYGCQMNRYDSMRLREILADEYSEVNDPRAADLIVINTCSVREKPRQKVFSDLGRMKPLKERKPELKLAVVGCVAQQEKKLLLDRAPHLDMVVGPDKLDRFPEILKRSLDGERPVVTGFDGGGFCLEARRPLEDLGREGRVTAFVSVQKGCDHFCTFCIVPHVRGREKSRPIAEVVEEVRRLADVGVREVTLLGQTINGYGADLDGGGDFTDLLYAVAGVEGIERLRFVTSHPAVMTDRHIAAIASIDKLCKYLHLPIQAGSDRILKLMNRGYTAGEYLSLVERLRAAIPGLVLSSDVIVGFPGETEKEFLETYRIVEEVKYHQIFSFVYSPRPKTRAARFDDPVPREVKLAWLARLQAMQKEITRRANEALLGTQQEILFDGISRRSPDDLAGRTRCNKIVNVAAGRERLGQLARVRITEAYQNSLRGELLGTADQP